MTDKEKLANAILNDAGVKLTKHNKHYSLVKNPKARVQKHSVKSNKLDTIRKILNAKK